MPIDLSASIAGSAVETDETDVAGIEVLILVELSGSVVKLDTHPVFGFSRI